MGRLPWQDEEANLEKKTWTTPRLVIHGDVRTLTMSPPWGCPPPDKVLGQEDGLVFQGQSAIICPS
jgi:hypothetical protein